MKRHYIFANSTAADLLNKGRLLMSRKRRRSNTTRHFQDKHGKHCWQGKSALRDSEPLVRISLVVYTALEPDTIGWLFLWDVKGYDI